ncbi:MAG: flagellar protein FlgN [Thermotaleaceae bacterium]
MSRSIEQLMLALKQEYDIYRDYLDLAKKKKDIIIKGQVKELDYITSLEQDMILKMGKIDKIRTIIIGNLLRELGVKEIANITELLKYIDEDRGRKLLSLREKLEDTIEEVQEINTLNGQLIEQSLEYVTFNLNLLNSVRTEGTTYGNRADEKNIQKRLNVFDAKI